MEHKQPFDVSNVTEIYSIFHPTDRAQSLGLNCNYKTYEAVGGNGIKDFVVRCLKRTFTDETFEYRIIIILYSKDETAELCSWTGQRANYKLAESPVVKILFNVVRKTSGISEKDFEIYVKEWFRHAEQRKERQLKKTTN